MPSNSIKAVIFGAAGTKLSEDETSFFSDNNPLGFILFKRNCDSPEQVKHLVSDLRLCVGREAPILIDQEGGRVTRLDPPYWRKAPAAGLFVRLAESNLEQAEKAVYLNARMIATELSDLGINVDCAPMADLLFPFSSDIIGDRSFGSDPQIVSALAGKMAQGLIDGGVIPVLKHIPGHGRAQLDSHKDLPLIDATIEELEQTDFIPFKKLNYLPWGMTAHITYTNIDREPATVSRKLINIIRNDIGFSGLLLSDDLSMKALKGSFAERTKKSIEAGCDVVLHCNGKMNEMQEVAANCPELSSAGYKRLQNSLDYICQPEPFDQKQAKHELENLLLRIG